MNRPFAPFVLLLTSLLWGGICSNLSNWFSWPESTSVVVIKSGGGVGELDIQYQKCGQAPKPIILRAEYTPDNMDISFSWKINTGQGSLAGKDGPSTWYEPPDCVQQLERVRITVKATNSDGRTVADAFSILLHPAPTPPTPTPKATKVPVQATLPLVSTDTPSPPPTATPSPSPVFISLLPTFTPVPPTPTAMFTPIATFTSTPTPLPTYIPMPTYTPMPPTNIPIPTPTTITSGSILFEENFEDGSANGFVSDEGTWQVIRDESDNYVYEVHGQDSSKWPFARFGSHEWKDYAVEYRVKLVYFEPTDQAPMGFLKFRATDQKNYIVALTPYWNDFSLNFEQETGWEEIVGVQRIFTQNIWYSVRVEANRTRFTVFLNSDLEIDTEDARIESGNLLLGTAPHTIAHFDDIQVIALGQ